MTIIDHYQGKKFENQFLGFFGCKPRVGEPTTGFLSGFKGLIMMSNPRTLLDVPDVVPVQLPALIGSKRANYNHNQTLCYCPEQINSTNYADKN